MVAIVVAGCDGVDVVFASFYLGTVGRHESESVRDKDAAGVAAGVGDVAAAVVFGYAVIALEDEAVDADAHADKGRLGWADFVDIDVLGGAGAQVSASVDASIPDHIFTAGGTVEFCCIVADGGSVVFVEETVLGHFEKAGFGVVVIHCAEHSALGSMQ